MISEDSDDSYDKDSGDDDYYDSDMCSYYRARPRGSIMDGLSKSISRYERERRAQVSEESDESDADWFGNK